eukprot:TRINITY_DN34332_c0_g1_i1.p1 TRINITY_DN34332_c0_g1~~TRINITY_DN34332_c0_g1_i1.p1  ORF type:complete len:112 (+),score=45.21 TRINITY_DN34332_c0_g1_i1:26-337(+)
MGIIGNSEEDIIMSEKGFHGGGGSGSHGGRPDSSNNGKGGSHANGDTGLSWSSQIPQVSGHGEQWFPSGGESGFMEEGLTLQTMEMEGVDSILVEIVAFMVEN